MIVCKECGVEVFIQQRKGKYVFICSPYYCYSCELFKNYGEVTYRK